MCVTYFHIVYNLKNPETTEVVIGNETYKVVVNSEDAENTEVVVTTLDPGSNN